MALLSGQAANETNSSPCSRKFGERKKSKLKTTFSGFLWQAGTKTDPDTDSIWLYKLVKMFKALQACEKV